MPDKDVLTQDEIDALLAGVDEGDVETVEGDTASGLSDYDLTNQDKVVRGRMPTLELISERFARLLRSDLPNSLKFPIEVGSGGVQVVKYSEYTDMLFVPTCIKLLRVDPFEGTCLITLDSKLIHNVVDCFFGGNGNVEGFEGREFTFTEKRVIDRIIDLVLKDYTKAWQDVMQIHPTVVGEEVNPGLVNVLSASEVMMVSSFRLELGDIGAELHIAFPYAALEPYRRLLDTTTKTEHDATDMTWRTKLEDALMDAHMPLNCVIGEAEVRLRDLMNFKVGDVIDISMHEFNEVKVSNVPTFKATLGDSRGKFALEFEKFLDRQGVSDV